MAAFGSGRRRGSGRKFQDIRYPCIILKPSRKVLFGYPNSQYNFVGSQKEYLQAIIGGSMKGKIRDFNWVIAGCSTDD
jgi:hypothetical protein